MHTKLQFHLTLIGLMILFSVTGGNAQTWEENVKSDIIRGRVYRIAWETAVIANAELCVQIPKFLKTVPHKRGYFQGIYAFQHGKRGEARQHFEAFLKTETAENRADPFFNLAQLWLQALEGKPLQKTLPKRVEPENRLRWKSELGYLLIRFGVDAEGGYKLCQESFKAAEQQGADGLDVFRTHLGYAALQKGDLELADKMFKAVAPDKPEYVDVYGEVDFFDGTTADLSLEFFSPAILNHRSEYFFRKAAEQAKQAAVQGNVFGTYWLGVCKKELGGVHLDEAIQNLQAVKTANTDPELSMLAAVQLGACYHLKGETDRAAEMWEHAAEASSPEVVNQLAETYIALNINLNDAVKLCRRSRNLLRQLPEYREEEDEDWFYYYSEPFKQYTWNLAIALYKTEQPKLARKVLKKVYPPGAKNVLDIHEDDADDWQMLSLRRHLTLAQLGRCHLDYTRYKEMYFYIYFREMLPSPGHYPETSQLFPCLRWLDLFKQHKPKTIIEEPN